MKPASVRVATLTMSDTRTPETDEGGRVLVACLKAGGYQVVSHAILREQADPLRESILQTIGLDLADAIVITGGTGVSTRDRTIEIVSPMIQKHVEGFGEAFRRLSWDEIGPNAILSRALMGVLRGRVLIALPGSPSAVRLAVERVIVPTLAHAVEIASGRGGHHEHGAPPSAKS